MVYPQSGQQQQPQGGQQSQMMPPGPPPAQVPPTPPSVLQGTPESFAIDPGGIRMCRFRYTYIWLRNRQAFWFYPTFIGRDSIAGYRWIGYRWVFSGLSLRFIASFQCF